MTAINDNWANALRGNQPIADVINAGKPAPTKVRKVELPGMHVGRGIRYGNLTWFPIFTDAPVADRRYVTETAGKVTVVENAQPNVGCLQVRNDAEQDVLLLEGSLLEAGWQHRAITRTVLIPAKAEVEIPVVCVEAGRWHGAATQQLGKRTAPARVRKAIRGIHKNDAGVYAQANANQSDVWHEIDNFAANVGKHNDTRSLVEMKRELEIKFAGLHTPKAIFGQRGVLVAVGGHPLALEVFDHPDTLAERLEGILNAYLPEAMAKPFVECKSQTARDFVTRVEVLGVAPTELVGRLRNKADKIVASEAVTTNTGEFLHLATLNARHELVLAA